MPADAYLLRIQRDLPATAPEHIDYVTNGMANDVAIVDRTWVYRFAKHDWSKPLMQHEATVLDLVRAHIDVPVPHLELLGDGEVDPGLLDRWDEAAALPSAPSLLRGCTTVGYGSVAQERENGRAPAHGRSDDRW